MKLTSLAIVLVFLLTSCSSYVPIAGDLIGMAKDTVVYVKDASIAKEALIHQTLQNRDVMYKEAYITSGTDISFKMQEILPGVWIQTIDMVSSKSPPVFTQTLPISPSIHPLWDTANKGIDLVLKLGLGWIIADGVTELWKRSAPQYNGPYNSYNQTAQPFVVDPVIIEPYIVNP